MREIWKQFRDTPFDVSTLGRVRRSPNHKPNNVHVKGQIIKGSINKNVGYRTVVLNVRPCVKVGFYVHRMVLEVFRGSSSLFGNHKDFDRLNNKLSNLEYVTHQQNIDHAKKAGRHKRGVSHYNAKFTDAQIEEIRTRALRGENQRLIAKEYGTYQGYVSQIKSGVRRQCQPE